MTLAEKDQTENIELAFRTTMEELGDRRISQAFFDPTSSTFEPVLQTTWKELCDQGWLEERELYGRSHYKLTGSGWVEGLWRTNAAKDRALSEKLGQLGAVLKGYVKGRRFDVTVEIARIVDEAKLSDGWVFNVLESSLFEKLLRKRGAHWVEQGTLVGIPLNFGLKLIDHTADIRTQLDEVQEELEHTKRELSEYRCSICGAPVEHQDYSVPLSEDVDGYVVGYACGRVDTDGYGERPCPSDSRFPKLEDYEFVIKESATEPSLKWSCLAMPKTASARQVSLQQGLGRTKEEARQMVIDCYTSYAKRWP